MTVTDDEADSVQSDRPLVLVGLIADFLGATT